MRATGTSDSAAPAEIDEAGLGALVEAQIAGGVDGLVACGTTGEAAAMSLSGSLQELGVQLGRLKTGTPPRLVRQSIDFSRCEPQVGDHPVPWFSFWKEDVWNSELFHVEHPRGVVGGVHREGFSDCSPGSCSGSDYPRASILAQIGGQVPCYITSTTERTREIILANLHRSPMYSGVIEGVGPRYCPSIEDKFVRFAQKESHQIFLEPEGIATDEIYVNGFSTCLPFEIQVEMVRSIVGCERAEIMRPAYAVEYDFAFPTQLAPTLEFKGCRGLFLAGQINGTSGYEEAAAQGLMAGINAVRRVRGLPGIVLRRDQAYIGVLIDDLVTKGVSEPYRMFTSRAEYRLSLRADNADQRLSEVGLEIGLLPGAHGQKFRAKQEAVRSELARLEATREGTETLAQLLRRPEVSYASLPQRDPSLPAEVVQQVEIILKYAGYISRQNAEVDRFRALEDRAIPDWIQYDRVPGLRTEARQKLAVVRPGTFGQAGRISGVSPADLSLVMVWVRRGPERGELPEETNSGVCAAEENLESPSAHNQCCGDL